MWGLVSNEEDSVACYSDNGEGWSVSEHHHGTIEDLAAVSGCYPCYLVCGMATTSEMLPLRRVGWKTFYTVPAHIWLCVVMCTSAARPYTEVYMEYFTDSSQKGSGRLGD